MNQSRSVRVCGVLFDMDGVLIDSKSADERSWLRWARFHGMEGTFSAQSTHGRRTIDTIRLLRPDLDALAELDRMEAFDAEETDGIVLLAGVETLISALPPNSWTIVTSASEQVMKTRLKRVGLKLLPNVVTTDSVTRGKPHADGAEDFARRLPAVPRALYLLFNEGYHGASSEKAVRVELCQEAMRLTSLLLKNPLGATPSTYALAALMSLNAARLPARLDLSGNLTALAAQDRSQFDLSLAEEGLRQLERAATGPELTDYHVEAAIAWVHTSAQRTEDTDWATIISLYEPCSWRL